MTLTNIKSAIAEKLKNNFPDIPVYAAEIQEGQQTPSYFCVYVLPISQQKQGLYWRDKKVSVSIVYFPPRKPDGTVEYLKLTEMADQLENLFDINIKITDRFIEIYDAKYDVMENTLEYSFTLMYTETVQPKEETAAVYFETLKINKKLKTGGTKHGNARNNHRV